MKHAIYVDGQAIFVRSDLPTLGAALQDAQRMPRLCSFNGLSDLVCSGVCFVYCMAKEKVVKACFLPNVKGAQVSYAHKDALAKRQAILQLLVARHPNACPVCEKKETCSLRSAVRNNHVMTPEIPPNIHRPSRKFDGFMRTELPRCVSCNLCVVFYEDVVGVPMIGGDASYTVSVLGRQESLSVFSGNLYEVCPVAALVPQKLWAGSLDKSVPGYDLHDAALTPLLWKIANNHIVGVSPPAKTPYRWLSNKARFSFDGFVYNRICAPSVLQQKSQKCVGWNAAITKIVHHFNRIGWNKVGILLGPFVDVETRLALHIMMQECGPMACSTSALSRPASFQDNTLSYTFGGKLDRVLESDCVILVGVRPLVDMPFLHTVLVRYMRLGRPVFSFADAPSPYGASMGADKALLTRLAQGEGPVAEVLKRSSKPLIVCGESGVSDLQAQGVWATIMHISQQYNKTPSWNPVAFVPLSASFILDSDMQYLQQDRAFPGFSMTQRVQQGHVQALWYIGFKPQPISGSDSLFIVYQNSHYHDLTRHADVVLPGCAYTEKSGLYVNVEGELCQTTQVTKPAKEVCDDAMIIQNILKVYNPNCEIIEREKLSKLAKNIYEEHFGLLGEKRQNNRIPLVKPPILHGSWWTHYDHYYDTNVVAAASPTMYQASRVYKCGKKGEVW